MTENGAQRNPGGERILVVEDDRALREGLAMNLRLQGYEVIEAADGDAGMKMVFDARPDLVILDIALPSWSGLDILESFRERHGQTPVLILSAQGTSAQKVEGLKLGADDYMSKPFDLPELLARVEGMLRRQRNAEAARPPLVIGELTIDRAARRVEVRGKAVSLSAREFDLLNLLAESPGQVFTRDRILESVWGWDYEGTDRTVDNFVARLRKKISLGRRKPSYIQTVPKVGYRFDSP